MPFHSKGTVVPVGVTNSAAVGPEQATSLWFKKYNYLHYNQRIRLGFEDAGRMGGREIICIMKDDEDLESCVERAKQRLQNVTGTFPTTLKRNLKCV
jgi:hypothetical protein